MRGVEDSDEDAPTHSGGTIYIRAGLYQLLHPVVLDGLSRVRILGDGDASELLRRGMEAQNNRPAAVRARRALLAVAEEDFHWWKKPLANDEEDDDSVPEVPGTTI